MARVRLILLASLLASGFACGDQIGDECVLSTDCSTAGDRICVTNSPGGYCTQLGCDVGTCPDEAVCVRFYPATSSNRPCDPETEDRTTNACTADEVCTSQGTCAPRNSEVRYCMRTCDGDDDCREEYECRTDTEMKSRGGEPVPKAGEPTGSNLQRFCAAEPVS